MPATPIIPNERVQAARARRAANAATKAAKFEWYIRNVSGKIEMTMKQRVTLATEALKKAVVRNISVPVVKGKSGGGRGAGGRFLKQRVVVLERSKPGEFPRADTTQLMKNIFGIVEQNRMGQWCGYVGTTLVYGAILEMSTKLDRSYLRRSHSEELPTIRRILTGPMKGAA
jgi:hypothetical protein